MSNITQIGTGDRDPKLMLLNAADEAEKYDEVVIVARRKDGGVTKWSTSKSHWFFFAAASILTNLANDALNDRIIDE